MQRNVKGIVHFEIKIWYLSAYPKGIQDVGVFFSSVDPILMFLGQTVLVCQSYNGRYRSLSLWEGKRTCTEKFKLNNSPSWLHIDGLRHKTSGLCEKTNSIYIVFYLLYTTMSKWSECTHIRCVTCVCARSGSRLTEGVSEAWCWRNCHRSCRFWTVYLGMHRSDTQDRYRLRSSHFLRIGYRRDESDPNPILCTILCYC